jgi:DNA-binding MarR family transcriptional regulator
MSAGTGVATEATVPVEEAARVAAFRAALRAFLHRSEQTARAHGLTPRQHLLLLLIKGTPDRSEQTTIGELADRMQLAQSSVTELVDRAEVAGLVTRSHASDDSRRTVLRLTESGERRLAVVFTGLTEERDRLRRTLRHAR